VLDVGCGFATTTERVQKLGNDVTGVELSPEAVRVAESRLARVVQADVTNFETSERFDAIILADVLEHLPYPEPVLRRYIDLLAGNGSLFVSLPNVGLWSVRFAHLFGSWEYEDTGVLDRTHLRFFTRGSAVRMLEKAGLTIVNRTYNPGLVRPFVPLAKKMLGAGESNDPAALMNSRPYKLYPKTVHPIERAIASLWPGMLAFQMIFEARLVPRYLGTSGSNYGEELRGTPRNPRNRGTDEAHHLDDHHE
jgi:SAM-dependent methyltransferase